MKKNYTHVGEFVNGYAFARLNKKVGVIDSEYNEVVPLNYDYLIGNINQKYFIGLCKKVEKYYPPVDYSNDPTFEWRVVGYEYYLLDKEGHKKYLFLDKRKFEMKYDDTSENFKFSLYLNPNSCFPEESYVVETSKEVEEKIKIKRIK